MGTALTLSFTGTRLTGWTALSRISIVSFRGGVFAKQLECLHRLKDEAGKHCSKTRKLIDVATSLAVEETRCYDQMIRSLEES